MTTPTVPIAKHTGREAAEMIPVVGSPVGSSKLTALTGEDERFAFQSDCIRSPRNDGARRDTFTDKGAPAESQGR